MAREHLQRAYHNDAPRSSRSTLESSLLACLHLFSLRWGWGEKKSVESSVSLFLSKLVCTWYCEPGHRPPDDGYTFNALRAMQIPYLWLHTYRHTSTCSDAFHTSTHVYPNPTTVERVERKKRRAPQTRGSGVSSRDSNVYLVSSLARAVGILKIKISFFRPLYSCGWSLHGLTRITLEMNRKNKNIRAYLNSSLYSLYRNSCSMYVLYARTYSAITLYSRQRAPEVTRWLDGPTHWDIRYDCLMCH